MTKRAKKHRAFLETSGVYYHRHGHSLMRAAVGQATADRTIQVSGFVRMEYLRGMVLNLIEFYFLIKESNSVADAILDWSQKVRQERKLKVFLQTVCSWLPGHEDWQDSAKSLRRLGEMIVRLVWEFDEEFPSRIRDRLDCRLGKMDIPHAAFQEDHLLRLYEQFRSTQKSQPDCKVCRFKEWQERNLQKQRIDLYSDVQRQTYRQNKGFVAQAERLEALAARDNARADCHCCERLGDAIIILEMPKTVGLVTADHAFVAFSKILNREIHLLPSLAELKKQSQESGGEFST